MHPERIKNFMVLLLYNFYLDERLKKKNSSLERLLLGACVFEINFIIEFFYMLII